MLPARGRPDLPQPPAVRGKMIETNSKAVLAHLRGVTLRVDPHAAADLKQKMQSRVESLWAALPETWNLLFDVRGGALDARGNLVPIREKFGQKVVETLKEVVDEEGQSLTLKPTQIWKSLEGLGFWAAAEPSLAACRNLFRAAELARIARTTSIRPAYGTRDGFRSWEPNLTVYRSQPLRVLVPKPGYVFLRGKVRELKLRVMVAIMSDENFITYSDSGTISDILDYRKSKPKLGYAATRVRGEMVALPDDDAYDLLVRHRTALPAIHADWRKQAREVFPESDSPGESSLPPDPKATPLEFRALLETCSYGLPNAYRCRVLEHDHAVFVTEKRLRELDDTLDLLTPSYLDYRSDRWLLYVTKKLGGNSNEVEGLLAALMGQNQNESINREIWTQETFTEEQWGELRALYRRDDTNPTKQFQIRQTLGQNGRKGLKSLGEPTIAIRLLEYLTRLSRVEIQETLKSKPGWSDHSLGGRSVQNATLTGLRRQVFRMSCEDVMLTIANNLLSKRFPLVALTEEEFLIEATEGTVDPLDVREAAEARAQELPFYTAGPVEVERVEYW